MMSTRAIILAAACISLVAALPAGVFEARYSAEEVETLFNQWAEKYNKVYEDGDKAARLSAFNYNLEFVHQHNKEEALGLQTYKVALNEFADQTLEEFVKARNGYRFNANKARSEEFLNGTAASSVDWRAKGAVTPVKNQGQCGSCWSFSATGSLEGANFLKTGKLQSFSEQELVDCDHTDHGCNGGLMDNAFEFVQANDITTEQNYPYTAMSGQCNAQKEAKGVGKCNGHTDVPQSSEAQLALAVAKQPVSVAIEADQSGFQLYHSGVFSGTCGTNLDHGVLAVGYGSEGSQKYWIVKNSWGASWGEQGYIRLAKDIASSSGQCGIAMMASYPKA